jgi:hypothetical protein
VFPWAPAAKEWDAGLLTHRMTPNFVSHAQSFSFDESVLIRRLPAICHQCGFVTE